MTPLREKLTSGVRLVCLRYDIPLFRTAAAPLLGENLNRSSGVTIRKIRLFLAYTYDARTLSIHVISFSIHTSKTHANRCPNTFKLNCIREQYFDLSVLLIGVYAVSLMDVTNSVFHGT
jgi:hypothetical protein